MCPPGFGQVICREYSKHVIICCAPPDPKTVSCGEHSQHAIIVCAPHDPECYCLLIIFCTNNFSGSAGAHTVIVRCELYLQLSVFGFCGAQNIITCLEYSLQITVPDSGVRIMLHRYVFFRSGGAYNIIACLEYSPQITFPDSGLQ